MKSRYLDYLNSIPPLVFGKVFSKALYEVCDSVFIMTRRPVFLPVHGIILETFPRPIK